MSGAPRASGAPDGRPLGENPVAAAPGFIGVGLIGAPMAQRLLQGGRGLILVERRNAGTRALVELGAGVRTSPAVVASEAAIVFACLPSNEALQTVLFGDDGLLRGRRMRVFVNLGTSGGAFSVECARRLAEAGIDYVDAPVSGGVDGARAGTLSAMVSGPRRGFEAAEPLLALFASNVKYLGDRPGAAQTLKVINNLLSATAFAVTAEGLAMGAKAGLDAETMLEVINASSGRNTATSHKFPRAVLSGTFDLGATTATILKDLGCFLAEAEERRTPAWIASVVRQYFLFSASCGSPAEDLSMLVPHLERLGGGGLHATARGSEAGGGDGGPPSISTSRTEP